MKNFVPLDIEYISRDLQWKTVFKNGKPTAIYSFEKQCPNELCSVKLQNLLNSFPTNLKNLCWDINGVSKKDYAAKQKVTPIKKHLTLIGHKIYRDGSKV